MKLSRLQPNTNKLLIKLINTGLVLFTLLLCSSITIGSLASDGTASFNLTEVASGIFLHEGMHVEFENPQHDDIANIGFILGENCVAVIDTGGSISIGAKLLSAIRKITNLPVCYVINTHVHFDHVLGNLAFADEKTEFVGHVTLVHAIEGNRAFFLEQFANDLGPNPSVNSIIGPSITVKDTLELDLGNRILLLTAYQTAHSHTDLTILDKKTNTLWTGDLLFKERIPALDGSLKGWLAVLDKLKNDEIKLVIPGHGASSIEWLQAIQAEKDYLNLLLKDTRLAIANGMFMDEVIDSVGVTEKKQWLLYEQHHRRNVSKAFTELEWE